MKILLLSPRPGLLTQALVSAGDSYICCEEKISVADCLQWKADYLVSYGYRHILPQSILELFPLRAINLHMSYLPYARGAHPNFWSIANGHPSGVTIHLIDKGLDTGNILFQRKVSLDLSKETFKSTYNVLANNLEQLFCDKWTELRDARSSGEPQVGLSSYSRTSDLNCLLDCLPDMWDTTIRNFFLLRENKLEDSKHMQ